MIPRDPDVMNAGDILLEMIGIPDPSASMAKRSGSGRRWTDADLRTVV